MESDCQCSNSKKLEEVLSFLKEKEALEEQLADAKKKAEHEKKKEEDEKKALALKRQTEEYEIFHLAPDSVQGKKGRDLIEKYFLNHPYRNRVEVKPSEIIEVIFEIISISKVLKHIFE